MLTPFYFRPLLIQARSFFLQPQSKSDQISTPRVLFPSFCLLLFCFTTHTFYFRPYRFSISGAILLASTTIRDRARFPLPTFFYHSHSGPLLFYFGAHPFLFPSPSNSGAVLLSPATVEIGPDFNFSRSISIPTTYLFLDPFPFHFSAHPFLFPSPFSISGAILLASSTVEIGPDFNFPWRRRNTTDDVNEQMDAVNTQIDGVNAHMDGVNTNIDGAARRLTKIDVVNAEMDGVKTNVGAEEEGDGRKNTGGGEEGGSFLLGWARRLVLSVGAVEEGDRRDNTEGGEAEVGGEGVGWDTGGGWDALWDEWVDEEEQMDGPIHIRTDADEELFTSESERPSIHTGDRAAVHTIDGSAIPAGDSVHTGSVHSRELRGFGGFGGSRFSSYSR